MVCDGPDPFGAYLRTLPDDLLESVAEDYLWLGHLFEDAEQRVEFDRRRERCRDECVRRGAFQLYQLAQSVLDPPAA